MLARLDDAGQGMEYLCACFSTGTCEGFCSLSVLEHSSVIVASSVMFRSLINIV